MQLEEYIKTLNIRAVSKEAMRKAKERLDGIAKPLDGLGSFENIICRLAGIYGTTSIDISKRIVVMMCADNGIVEEGVSQTTCEVTNPVACSMSEGRSSVCRMAEREEIDTLPVDVGIKIREGLESYSDLTEGEKGHYRLFRAFDEITTGTENFLKNPAMTEEQLTKVLKAGVELTGRLVKKGYRIICTGEMGIGNTTTSTAVAAALLHADPDDITGRGAGLDEKGLERKRAVIKQAISKYKLYDASATEVVRCVGGFDIAGLAGLFIGGAVYGVPVVTDGLISAAAALFASKLIPGCKEYMLASHIGDEKGTGMILDELGLTPVLNTKMKLGEGTGAVMLIPLLDMALTVYDGNVTFDDISVKQYERFQGI
ncbi:MAG: nicotinate-nucleotide--dimethylbenzimidazole phosphoribosyltransferase [Lachnospiraceae bacterium]|nr:nicotinate-nucleotide--dimethylbenzimidazole phosphoribosyltransferase [Lachnospiraceae bacterium]